MHADRQGLHEERCVQPERGDGRGHDFARTEGIVVAPETSHAVKGAIDIALQCKQKNEEKVILFNLSGHGLLDLKAYEDKLAESSWTTLPTRRC